MANATQQSIRSIIRRSQLTPQQKLNILTFCTHERYEQNLCKTGHNFYAINQGKTWNKDFGVIPDNYHEIDVLPWHVGFDLVLCHTSCDRLITAKKIQNMYNIPIIRHTHVLPDVRLDVQNQIHSFNSIEVDHNSFISNYNRSAWGYGHENTSFIEHGIDYKFWSDNSNDEKERENVCISVVNQWPNRDWCCGWNLWKETVGFSEETMQASLPIKVLGDSPGLSEAAPSIESLRGSYRASSVFLNTSLHSPVPTVLMEAMASGCAIVSTNNCMIPEIIQHGENGLLADTADDLRASCQYLLNNPDESRRLGQNAQDTIKEKYNLERFVHNWNELFFGTIDNYRK
jgi:hypothetical protein